jgi:hypothetical protein
MKRILLTRDHQDAVKDLEGKFPSSSHVRKTLMESTEARTKDGIVRVFLACNVIPTALHKLAYELWNAVDELPDNRPAAVGSASLRRIKDDGMLSGRRGVPKQTLRALRKRGTAQGLLGYLDASSNEACHRTPLTKDHPEMLKGNERLIKLVDELYKLYAPAPYERQRAEIEEVPQWRLWGTVFSTIYLARNFRTAYHYDPGNLKGVMTALMPMGNFTGGELVLPRWRLSVAFRPGDVLFFDSTEILHGNLPFKGHRLSAAFYCERRIGDCGE